MLILCATKTEAVPIIEALKMQKIACAPYSLFANDEHRLLITGIGAVAAAAACGYALGQKEEPLCNIGYAAGNAIGKLYNISKVVDTCTHKVYHLPKSEHLPNAACTTLPQPATKRLETLADMEASAIVQAAKRFKQPCKILKIVSDAFNPQSCPHDSSLIEVYTVTILREISLQSPKNFQGNR